MNGSLFRFYFGDWDSFSRERLHILRIHDRWILKPWDHWSDARYIHVSMPLWGRYHPYLSHGTRRWFYSAWCLGISTSKIRYIILASTWGLFTLLCPVLYFRIFGVDFERWVSVGTAVNYFWLRERYGRNLTLLSLQKYFKEITKNF